jgi:hypothetical protein
MKWALLALVGCHKVVGGYPIDGDWTAVRDMPPQDLSGTLANCPRDPMLAGTAFVDYMIDIDEETGTVDVSVGQPTAATGIAFGTGGPANADSVTFTSSELWSGSPGAVTLTYSLYVSAGNLVGGVNAGVSVTGVGRCTYAGQLNPT